MKIFLNADTKLSRLLLVKFLSTLRTIQTWARTQTTIRIFSSSLLLAYDAKEFKNHLDGNQNNSNSSTVSSRSSSVDSTSNKHTPTASMGEPMANANGDTRYDGCNGSNHLFNNTDSIELCKKLNRSHSTQNNYENVSCQLNFSQLLKIGIENFQLNIQYFTAHSQGLRFLFGQIN